MQKYKQWKQALSVSTAVCLSIAGAGSLMGCGNTDRGKDKADSVESKAMGRYLENELSVPEGCMEIVDLQVMKEGSLIVMPGNILDMMQVYEELDNHISESGYDVCCFGYDPYNAREFVERWERENGPFGIVKVIQGSKTESVPLGELKKLSEERMLLFDEALMTFTMGNCIVMKIRMETVNY